MHLVGGYAQRDAPSVFRRAHVLLHTKVKDPCPTLVVEAMACGLPVVYPASGGTSELVGDVGGIGVAASRLLGARRAAVSPRSSPTRSTRVLDDLPSFSAAARTRAVERFSLEPWLERHAEIFERLAPR